MELILAKAVTQGLGYALFCFLLFYVLKKQDIRDGKSEQREVKYQDIIHELTTTVSCKLDKVEVKIEEILKR
ncbi:UviB-like protein [Clostridium tagluense]|uniref:BhlA/UviB family holin-like peptide n=1 Tax=Clostridium tagluense TaxID=360422 RepID=UPI001C0CAA05|nr:BhlA/UviB family holin-like peptide [Clostridium tagluense]MBU3127238.1 UviB-like protein [Clostridium tagluense]MCB2312287.1 UviB-like protein [Clostridium tagluense]MCB2316975.1 UviB-like protein [Clostridium tagluense]MCB2321826.1 UviB-like protein [Clostridium tagluense]MCB2326754.1 UviB-like protein [Clostridium tagluense]